jgi:hypothetical protein
MPGTLIYFENADGGQLVIRPESPSANDTIICRTYDLGSPDPKASIEERVGRNGVNDNTSLHGASQAKFDLLITPGGSATQWQTLETLKAWLDPTKRYYLCYKRYGETDVWRAVYRPEPWALVVDKTGGVKLPVSVSLKLPEGCYESAPVAYDMRPSGAAVGFSAPFSAPFSLTPSSGTGAVSIVVGGTRPVPFKAYVYGGQTGPVIMDTDTGRKLSFTANGELSIPQGSYVEVDTEKGTALLNGDPNNSVYQYIDFTVSQWWALRGGETNRLTVSATTSDGSAQTIIYVASRRL